MDRFFEQDGKKFRVLEVNSLGMVISAREVPDAVFEDLPEYDFSKGIRGKYIDRYKEYLEKQLGKAVDIKV